MNLLQKYCKSHEGAGLASFGLLHFATLRGTFHESWWKAQQQHGSHRSQTQRSSGESLQIQPFRWSKAEQLSLFWPASEVLLVGGWHTPLKNMLVSWDDCSQYMESHKSHVSTHQAVFFGDRSDGPFQFPTPAWEEQLQSLRGRRLGSGENAGPVPRARLAACGRVGQGEATKKSHGQMSWNNGFKGESEETMVFTPFSTSFSSNQWEWNIGSKTYRAGSDAKGEGDHRTESCGHGMSSCFFLVHNVDSCRFPMLNCWKEVWYNPQMVVCSVSIKGWCTVYSSNIIKWHPLKWL